MRPIKESRTLASPFRLESKSHSILPQCPPKSKARSRTRKKTQANNNNNNNNKNNNYSPSFSSHLGSAHRASSARSVWESVEIPVFAPTGTAPNAFACCASPWNRMLSKAPTRRRERRERRKKQDLAEKGEELKPTRPFAPVAKSHSRQSSKPMQRVSKNSNHSTFDVPPVWIRIRKNEKIGALGWEQPAQN